MKVVVRVKPGDNPEEVARKLKATLESNIGMTCSVRVVGGPARPQVEGVPQPRLQ